MKSSRVKNALINLGTTTIAYTFTMLSAFIVRAFLSRTLGQSYVGLNGVLTSVISSLSLADLGIDSVFVYLMYRPIAEDNHDEARALMRLFRKIYFSIGSIFIFAGVCLTPFLQYIIGHEAMEIPHVVPIYIIFMLNTGLSYFFAYYRVTLNADQKAYVIARITLVITVFTNVVQIIFLVVFKNFLFYVILLLICTVAINIIVGLFTMNHYDFTKTIESGGRYVFQRKDTINVLIRNTIGGISNKVGGIVVYASNNILLANFTKLKFVGMYSNYSMITSGLSTLLVQVIGSVTGSLGNLGTENNEKKNFSIYSKMTFGVNSFACVIFFPLVVCFSKFIELWVGAESVLPVVSVELITINFILQILRFPSLTFIDAFGLQWLQRWKSIVEAVFNIVFSLFFLLGLHLGLNGVLLGTFISNVFVVNWYEPYLILKNRADRQYKLYVRQFIPFIFLLLMEIVFSGLFLRTGQSFLMCVVVSTVGMFVLAIILLIIYRNDERLHYFLLLLPSIKRKR